jgi:hypothetical protein
MIGGKFILNTGWHGNRPRPTEIDMLYFRMESLEAMVIELTKKIEAS